MTVTLVSQPLTNYASACLRPRAPKGPISPENMKCRGFDTGERVSSLFADGRIVVLCDQRSRVAVTETHPDPTRMRPFPHSAKLSDWSISSCVNCTVAIPGDFHVGERDLKYATAFFPVSTVVPGVWVGRLRVGKDYFVATIFKIVWYSCAQ